MLRAGLDDLSIVAFEKAFETLCGGDLGEIAEKSIEPVESLPEQGALTNQHLELGQKAQNQCVLIKLNGGLGTSMGLQKAKSLLDVKNGLSFLDIVVRQAGRAGLPLALMNSFATEADTFAATKSYEEDGASLHFFRQSMAPKLNQSDLQPTVYEEQPDLEWCPPGHGEIYRALASSGMINKLIAEGRRYAFISNSDNLGATFNEKILGYMIEEKAPFLMEVSVRTPLDRKGGHLAMRDGQLILRERAQCPKEDLGDFEDISKHRYFNTNNLWVDLHYIRDHVSSLHLPLIVNKKTVNPRDPQSTPVYQLESAMGAVISCIEGAKALCVNKDRFAPVKTTNELLVVRSDAYVLTEDERLVLAEETGGRLPVVHLDDRFYKTVDQLEERFPAGVPSLKNCRSLIVKGDVKFPKPCVLSGEQIIENQAATQMQYLD